MNRIGCALFVLTLTTGCSSGETAPADDDGPGGAGGGTVTPAPTPSYACPAGADEAFAAMAQSFAAELDQNGVPGGAVAMLCGGELRRVEMHGVVSVGGAPVTADTRFQWASTTKMFTGAAAVALADEGVVDLHAEVSAYAPHLAYPGVTLHHLLSHTAGYPTEFPVYSSDLSTVAEANGQAAMWSPPGTVHLYSNPGFAIAGHVLARAAGLPYAQLVEQRLFEPAQMAATFDVDRVMAEDHAWGHRPSGPVAPNGSYLHTTTYGPMGGAWGSVTDMARWAQVHLTPDGVMTAEAIERHRTGHTMTGIPATEYGYGLFVQNSVPRIVHHGGGTDGYLCDWQLLPDEGFGLFMVVNADWFLPSTLADDLVDGLYAPTFEPLPAPGTAADYVGTFHDPHELGTIEVTELNGALTAHFVATGIDAPLDYAYGDVYYADYAPTGGWLDLHFWRPGHQGPATHVVSLWGIAPRVPE